MILIFLSVFIDPGITFQELESEHFTIVYPQDYESLAVSLASYAEDFRSRMVELGVIKEDFAGVTIVILDNVDIPGGYSYILPDNTIVLYAHSGDFFENGDFDRWLNLVFVHEFTHVIEWNKKEGFWKIPGFIFGRTFHPYQYQPVGLIEGYAVYSESRNTGYGRMYSAFFRTVASTAKFPSLMDFLSGNNRDWPFGMTSYIYGSLFMNYIDSLYSNKILKEIIDGLVKNPLFPGVAFRKWTGKSMMELWDDFRKSIKDTVSCNEGINLTSDGDFKRFLSVENGRIVYSYTIRRGGRPCIVAGKRRIELYQNGRGWIHEKYYYAPVLTEKDGFYLYNNLYRINIETGGIEVIKGYERINSVCLDSKGNIFAVVNKRCILKNRDTIYIPEKGNIENISISPGDSFLAIEIVNNAHSELHLFNLNGGKDSLLLYSDKIITMPFFADDTTILFVSEAGKKFFIFTYDLMNGIVHKVVQGFSPVVSQDTLYYLSFDEAGIEVVKLSLWRGKSTPGEIVGKNQGHLPYIEETVALRKKKYFPFRHMIPHGMIPIFQPAIHGPFMGLAFFAEDPLHNFFSYFSYVYKFGDDFSYIEGMLSIEKFVRPTLTIFGRRYFPIPYTQAQISLYFPEENIFSSWGFGMFYEYTKMVYYKYNTMGLYYNYSNIYHPLDNSSPQGIRISLGTFRYGENFTSSSYPFEIKHDIRIYKRFFYPTFAFRMRLGAYPVEDLLMSMRNIESFVKRPVNYAFWSSLNISTEFRIPIYLKTFGISPFYIRDITLTIFNDIGYVWDCPSFVLYYHFGDIMREVSEMPSFFGGEIVLNTTLFNKYNSIYRIGIANAKISKRTYMYIAKGWSF